MKKKYLKIAAFIVSLILIGGILTLANGMVGNPISKHLAERSALKRLETMYKEYELKEVFYSFKDGCYYARLYNPSSEDSDFNMVFDWRGQLEREDYEERVLKRRNTADRLEREYRELADKVLESTSYPYEGEIRFGSLCISSREYMDDPKITDIPDFAIASEDLELDKSYDISELGRTCGELTIYVEDQDVSPENAADIMIDIKRRMDEAGIGFRAMDFKLSAPREEEENGAEEWIGSENFLYEHIYEEGMEERIVEADKLLKEYYERLDALKNAK